MALTKNQQVLDFVAESAALGQPDRIVWIDGSEAQIKALKDEAVRSGELIKLNENLLPDCYLHRTKVNDVARVEDRTFICTKNKEDAGPINYWMDPRQAYELANEIARGSMKGRTMYVIPYSMGVVGSDFAKIGIEVTDSIYVVLNMNIMTWARKFWRRSARTANSSKASTPSATSTRTRDTLCTSPRTTRLFP